MTNNKQSKTPQQYIKYICNMNEMQNLGTWEKGFKLISTLPCQILPNKATLDSLL
jgi:hypothetical protein